MQFQPAWLAPTVALAAALGAAPAVAGPAVNVVVNGDFETTSITAPTQVTATNVAGWTTNPGGNSVGYTFLYFAGTGDGTPTVGLTPANYPGATNSSGGDSVKLWGPKNGSNNGFTTASPTGGNFIASDPAYNQGPIYQSIGGLTIGTDYLLTFYWAAAQQYGFDGATTESWTVTFGTQAYTTLTVNNANHGFVPWMKETVMFRAKANTQTLSFMANGGPNGLPPFALLDGVSLFAVPEPATWAVLLGAVVGIGSVTRRRRA